MTVIDLHRYKLLLLFHDVAGNQCLVGFVAVEIEQRSHVLKFHGDFVDLCVLIFTLEGGHELLDFCLDLVFFLF